MNLIIVLLLMLPAQSLTYEETKQEINTLKKIVLKENDPKHLEKMRKGIVKLIEKYEDLVGRVYIMQKIDLDLCKE